MIGLQTQFSCDMHSVNVQTLLTLRRYPYQHTLPMQQRRKKRKRIETL